MHILSIRDRESHIKKRSQSESTGIKHVNVVPDSSQIKLSIWWDTYATEEQGKIEDVGSFTGE